MHLSAGQSSPTLWLASRLASWRRYEWRALRVSQPAAPASDIRPAALAQFAPGSGTGATGAGYDLATPGHVRRFPDSSSHRYRRGSNTSWWAGSRASTSSCQPGGELRRSRRARGSGSAVAQSAYTPWSGPGHLCLGQPRAGPAGVEAVRGARSGGSAPATGGPANRDGTHRRPESADQRLLVRSAAWSRSTAETHRDAQESPHARGRVNR